MKVKSFVQGTINGLKSTFNNLDRKVEEELGTSITIHSITDSVYQGDVVEDDNAVPQVVRVIVYD